MQQPKTIGEGNPPDFNDPFRPPSRSRLVHCIHCGCHYQSREILWNASRDLWCCPMPSCDGAGYGVDIHDVRRRGS